MDIRNIVSQMSLEEKAGMCSGLDFWRLKPVERLGVKSVMVSDGPHGLRKQAGQSDHLGLNDSVQAVCFPAACATAASFDRDLMRSLGEILGNECQAEDISVLLGPAINIKRSPLCGRNFEYMSEDPYLTGELAASYTAGVQSRNTGVSVKHYAVNNQEDRRMSISAEADERTLREIYLPGFEAVVKKAKPWTVMCSNNRVNGEYVSQSKKFLTEILRDEWGFDGYVMTDWGACDDRVAGLIAGQDLEMPGSGGVNDKEIVAAVKNGTLDEAVLDRAVERILTINQKYLDNRNPGAVFDREKDHNQARSIAGESMVLLKNEDNILPLGADKKIAFIGYFAEHPRYQGSGSSHINPTRVTGALEAVKGIAAVSYAQGYIIDEDRTDEKLFAEAVTLARSSDIAVVFAGLPDSFESEGFDRTHMRMPRCQDRLIEEIARVQKNTVVVLHNGSPVEMPWLGDVKGLLESYLCGEAVGLAQADILFGKVNPSAKLPETFPVRLEDNPSYLNFPGGKDTVEYREGVFVGYRYYDSVKRDVLFPFGYGLSYTTYEYKNMKLDKTGLSADEQLKVSLTVKNTGKMKGKEIVQVYVREKEKSLVRPDKELKGFVKVELLPGEEKEVSVILDKRSFAYYDTESGWTVSPGIYEILAGASSRDIRLSAEVKRTDPGKPLALNRNTLIGDILSDPKARAALEKVMDLSKIFPSGGNAEDLILAIMKNAPLRILRNFGGGELDGNMLEGIIRSMKHDMGE